MARSVVLLVIGMIAGGAAVTIYRHVTADDVGTSAVIGNALAPVLTIPAATLADAETGVSPDEGRVSARVALFRSVSGATDPFDLERNIDFAAAQPRSNAREIELEVLLARLAEIDAARAVEVAQSLYLELRFMEPLYKAWATADFEAALAAVGALGAPGARRRAALALLDVAGYDKAGVSLVAAGLPETERLGFEADAIIRRAESDPSGALEAALGLVRSTMQQTVLLAIADSAGRSDPLAALAQSASIGNESFRDAFTRRVMSVWAERDPEDVFALLESPGFSYLEESTGAFQALAAADPDRLLGIASGLPTRLRQAAHQTVLSGQARKDPLGALTQLDELIPPGEERDSVLQSIVSVWGEQDPDAALTWVRSLTPPSQTALSAVLRGVSQVDFDRAVDIVIAESEQQGPAALGVLSPIGLTLILGLGSSGDMQFERVVDRLAGVSQAAGQSLLRTTLSRWATEEPEAALSWAIANADRIDSSALQSMASTAARDNPDIAIQTLNRLPTNQRQGWIEGVAQGLAATDVNRAIDFISQFRGQPAYDNALSSIVMRAAQSDPRRAAELIASSPPSPRTMSAAGLVATQWAEQDPRAAIEWVSGLDDERSRTLSLQQIATVWAQSDPSAARSWLMGVPPGGSRDAALTGYLSSMAQLGSFEDGLLESYSTDAAKQQGAMSVAIQIGRTDPELASRLIDRHITDPGLRRQAEEMLARTGGTGSGGLIRPGGIVIF